MSALVSPIDVSPAPVAGVRPAVARRRAWHRRHRAALLLALLTLFGAQLRFLALDRPSLWGDEAATYSRVSGTYRDMLDVLRDAWFPPLHYELYWWLSRHVPMDPFGMRLVPAIAGTLMVPAMYFLARQMVGRSPSLLVAAFTACSAYMLAYSRDAKMYMGFWLCATLSTACLLWWTRTGRSTAWLGWVAGGVAMAGLHGMGFAVLALHVLFFLTARGVTGLRAVAVVLGVVVICAGDAVHYGGFNVVAEQIEDRGWRASGIDWADVRNQGQPAALIVVDTLSAYLQSFLWIQEPTRGVVPERVARLMAWTLAATLALALVGAMPWPRRFEAWRLPAQWRGRFALFGRRATPAVARAFRPVSEPSERVTTPDFASDSHGLKARATEELIPVGTRSLVDDDGAPEPAWRAGLWLSMWILLPMYAFYCASTDVPMSPAGWADAFVALVGGRPWVLAGCAVAACALTQTTPWATRLMALAAAGVVAWLVVDSAVRGGAEASADWVGRLAARAQHPVVAGGLIALVAGLWFDRAGETVPARVVRSIRFMAIVIALWAVCALLHRGVESYFADRAFLMGRESGGDGLPGRKSIWMPRWLAVVWPAVAIVLCVLLARLPTRPLRWTAVAFVLAVNLAQFGARLTVGSEPPLARLAADVLAGQGNGGVRTYVERTPGGGAPGTGNIEGYSGRYYLHRAAGRPSTPMEFRRNVLFNELSFRTNVNPQRVADDVRDARHVNRLICWTTTGPARPVPDDDLTARLGPAWRLVDDDLHHVRSFWNWAEFYQQRRREYVREVQPDTAAANDQEAG